MNLCKLVLCSSLLLTAIETYSEVPKKVPMFEQGMALSENRYPKGYNAPARIAVNNSYSLDIDASFIYWHVSQELMDIGDKYLLSNQTPETIVYHPFSYKPGFKIGAGWKTDYDSWSFFAEYTRLHQQTSYSTTFDSNHYWNLSSWFNPTDLAQTSLGTGGHEYFPSTLSSFWKMHFDLLDIAASRTYYQGRAFSLSPYAGLRAVWITQGIKINANQNSPSFARSANRSHCWSLGPNIGFEGNWLFNYGFRLEGLASTSLLYTSYTELFTSQSLSAAATVSTFPLNFKASTGTYNAIRPSIELGLGMGWGNYFSQGRYFLDLSARYDFLQFWSQNMMRYWTSSIYGAAGPIGDLQFHGLTATAQLDF